MKAVRYLVPLAIAGIALVTTGLAQASHSGSYAGTWHLAGHLHCVDSPKTAWACADVVQGTAPVFSKAGTTFDDVQSITAKVSASGKFTYSGTLVYSQSVPHGKSICSANVIGTLKMSGSCKFTETGSGHVSSASVSRTHMPDFYVDHVKVTIHGNPVTHATDNNSHDTGSPAVVGRWNLAAYLKLIHEKRAAPQGVTFSLTMSRS